MNQPWTDGQILAALILRDRGVATAWIAAALGRDRYSLARLLSRIDRELAAVTDLATRPENRDGGMPWGWWREGLVRRRERQA